jgi:hypothetical protein
MVYRYYLTGSEGRILAAGNFVAEDDTEASEIARVICDSSEGECLGYELWRGPQKVEANPVRYLSKRKLTVDRLTRACQLVMVDLEDSMQRSFACIASSKALMARLDEARQLLARTQPGD